MPRFSIITVCFNSEKTIERTIKSIYCQQYKDYEYIIVDGGSRDCTVEIIKRYEPLFEGRMNWESEPDNGIYDAFNKGLRKSKGEYVWFVNSDDWIQNDSLNFLSHVIEKYDINNLPIISASMNFIDAKTGHLISIISSNDKSCKVCYKRNMMGLVHPATLVPNYIYRKIGMFDSSYRIIGDLDWFHRAYTTSQPMVFSDHVITNMSNAGVSNELNWKRYVELVNDRHIFLKKYYKNPLSYVLRFSLWQILFIVKIAKDTRKRAHIK